jgi:hypothetical protein
MSQDVQSVEPRIRTSLELACQCQNTRNILRGRAEILSLPRDAVLAQIDRVASEYLDLTDEWEFRRLLEVYKELDKHLLRELVSRGLQSANSEIREAACDFED